VTTDPRAGTTSAPAPPWTQTESPVDSATVKELERLVNNADPRKRIVPAPGEPYGAYYTVGEDGEMTLRVPAYPADTHEADDLDTVAAVAERWKDGGGFVSVWYDRAAAQAVGAIDGERPRTCVLSLNPSPQLAQLAEWRNRGRVMVPQKELVVLLRTLFDGCWANTPTLLTAVRSLRTSKAAEVNSQIERGRVSLGKSMVAEMSGVGAIPEEVRFVVPVFTGAAAQARAEVRVAVDPDPETEQFTLIVLPEEIERAYWLGEERLRVLLEDLLEGSEIPLYHGRP
jgi:hypothetical protein